MKDSLNKVCPMGGQNVCNNCHCSYNCGTLLSALEVLRSLMSDRERHSFANEAIVGFFEKIEGHGFGYPETSKQCDFFGETKAAIQLTFEAIQLIKSHSLTTHSPMIMAACSSDSAV